jgi:hypothetical protein
MKTKFLIVLALIRVNAGDVPYRLAYGLNGGFGISWNVPLDVDCGSLAYGFSPESLDKTVDSFKSCKLYKGGYHHHVFIPEIRNATKYFFRISCSNETHTFRTGLAAHSKEPFTFAVYGDLGPVYGENTLAALASNAQSLAGHIFAGDIGYADDAFMHGQSYIARTSQFIEALSRATPSVPIMVVPGNHEAEDHTPVCLLSPGCRHGFGNFSAYNCIWNMPSEGHRHSMWYSFNYGPIHFVMTNTETDYEGAPLEPYGEVGFIPTGKFGQKGEYEQWLREDIMKAHQERHIRPWIIVVGHRPITVLDEKSDPFVTPLNQAMIDLIGTYADVYVAGHVHYYARSIPKPHAPFQAISITVGGSGCDEWSDRRIQDTRRGETEYSEYFGYGDEQTFGLLKYEEDELVFEIQKSRNQQMVDRVVIPKRLTRSVDTVPILITQ